MFVALLFRVLFPPLGVTEMDVAFGRAVWVSTLSHVASRRVGGGGVTLEASCVASLRGLAAGAALGQEGANATSCLCTLSVWLVAA